MTSSGVDPCADPGAGSAPVGYPPAGSARLSSAPAVILVRHGETEWSKSGRHTGRTDVALTATGEAQAVAAGRLVRMLLGGRPPGIVISSPRQRATRTAQLAGFRPDELTEAAAEWDYGDFEGLTTSEIRRQHPGWTVWSGPVPSGERPGDVAARVDGLLARAEHDRAAGPIVLFSHGHACRCIAARWLCSPVTAGRHWALDTGAVSVLGHEHDQPVISRWNLSPELLSPPG